MDTRSAVRWRAKAGEGAGVRYQQLAAEVAEAADAVVVSVFSGARLVSIEIGGGAGAEPSGRGAAGSPGPDGESGRPEPLPALWCFSGFKRYGRSSARRSHCSSGSPSCGNNSTARLKP